MRSSILFALFRRAAVLILVLLMATAISAQITPSDDSYISSTAPTTNYGTAKTLNLSSAVNTAFIRFDLTAVPAGYTGASIAKATLKLYVNTCTKSGSFNVDLVNGTWAEKTITYSLQPALGTTIAASVPLTTSSKLDYIEIDITPAVVDWLNGTENDGIALVANSPLVATFDSKESTTTSQPPELDIVFAGGGGGGTITGVLTPAGSGLTGGGTSGTLNLSLLTSCGSGQVLEWNGSAWACTSLSGGGTITGVTAGTDLTGGGTSGNVTLNLDITKVPQLGTANTFTGNQTVNANLSATGIVTGSSFQIGSNLFAFGTYSAGNAFLGFAGNAAMTGTGNTATGYRALAANSSGNANTATGNSALSSNTTGGTNSAHGNGALSSNTTGAGNTASGISALYKNTTGGYNTADGNSALSNNTTGSSNSALGYNAGPDSASTNLTNATAIGANAVVSQSNALVLGNAVNVGIGTAKPAYTLDVNGTGNFTGLVKFATSQTFPNTISGITTASGSGLTGGGTSGTLNLSLVTSCASGQVLAWSGSAWACANLSGGGTVTSVGLTAPSTDFVVTGSPVKTSGTLGLGWLVAPDPNNTANAIVKRDSSGNFSAGTINAATGFSLGGNPFAFGSYSYSNAFLGFAGNAATKGPWNTATGSNALSSNTTGASNTASGSSALSSNTSGSSNTASGANALFENTTGSNNTANGYGALTHNQSSNNTASGYNALTSNDQGSNNTASGYQALFNNMGDANGNGWYNTADGAQALYSNGLGSYNVASGYQALYSNRGDSNSGGWANTAVGPLALYSNTLGSENIAIGDSALYSNTGDANGNGWYNVAIGQRALVSNLGYDNTAIGVFALDSNTTGNDNTAVGYQSLDNNTTGWDNVAVGHIALRTNTTGIANTALGYQADVGSGNLGNATAIGANAQVTASNSLVLGSINGVNGAASSTKVGIGTTAPSNVFTIAQNAGKALGDGWTTYSSRRWKTNIHTLHGALGKVEKLRGVSYDLKANGQHEVGVIAEEVGAVVPEVVTWEKNGKDAQSVDYGRLTALLIEATKEQQALIREQKEQIRAQQAQIVRLTREVKTIQATLKATGRSGTAVRTVKAEGTTVHQ